MGSEENATPPSDIWVRRKLDDKLVHYLPLILEMGLLTEAPELTAPMGSDEKGA